MKLYVGNLSYDTNDASLRQAFGAIGQVATADVVTDRETGRSRGFGFVEMASDADARKAIETLNDTSLDGRNITVAEARPRADRDDRGSGGSRGRGGSSSRW
jgi:RNA recognition motif-containing protein